MKQKLLKTEQVKTDAETYPRIMMDFVTSARYYNALRSGAKFPPITVAKLGKTYYLVDGAHRLKAYKDTKQTHIQVEVLTKLKSKKQIYIEAVKRNIIHGRQFSTQEVTKICITLEKWKMSQKAISNIVRIPAKEIRPFVAKRMTRITETMEEIPLKAPLQNLAGVRVPQGFDQGKITNRNQVSILDNLITLLENNWIDTTDELVIEKLDRIYKLLKGFR